MVVADTVSEAVSRAEAAAELNADIGEETINVQCLGDATLVL